MSEAHRLQRTVSVVAACAVGIMAVIVLATGAPVAWLLLGLSGVLTIGVLVVAVVEGRFFEPLTVLAAVALISFVVRPLQLFANAYDLLSYYTPPPGVDALLKVENQEIALFVTRDLMEPLEPALTRAMGVVTVFIALVIVGYFLPLGRRLGRRVSTIGGDIPTADVRAVVAICLALAAAGQLAVIVTLGGPVQIAESALEFKAYKTSVGVHILMGFGLAGILVWAAWSVPRSRRARVAFGAATFEVCVFYAITGSRTRLFLTLFMLAVISHYVWRGWRLRSLAIGGLVIVVAASAILAVRQATTTKPLAEAITSAPAYITDPRGLLNDFTEFDAAFMATAVIGSPHDYRAPAPFQYGEGLVDAFRSYIPGFIDPGKPQSGDQEFRELIFGDEFRAGRPYTVVGDLWNDFGLPGVVIGSLLFGLLCRALLGLLSSPTAPGREYRAGLYAIGVMLIYLEAIGTYSVTLGYILTFGVPFLVAVHVIAPAVQRARRLSAGARGRSGEPEPT